MDKRKVKKIIKYFENILKKGIDVQKILIFGSYSEGKFSEESDLDLIIISKDFEGKNLFERAELTKEAEISTIKKFMIPMDIITLTPEEWKKEKSLLIKGLKKEKSYHEI